MARRQSRTSVDSGHADDFVLSTLAQSDGVRFFNQLQERRRQTVRELKALQRELARIDDEILAERKRLGLSVERDKKELAEQAKVQFNDKPKKGIAMLINGEYFDNGGTADEIAGFLYHSQGLSKTSIGEYLGGHTDLHRDVLDAFVGLHDFSGQPFDQALRTYLWSFRLPGEAQKIDRMMQVFASRFCQCNPNIFKSNDGCYVLAFSTIMLNTSLHNPSVQFKPTVEDFITMNRGIDDGSDVDRDVLIGLYNSISETPFKIPEDEEGLSIMFFNPERQGWLYKQGGSRKTWRKRWVVLNNSCIFYFKHMDDETPLGIVPLANVQLRMLQNAKSSKPKRSRSKVSVTTEEPKEGEAAPTSLYFELVGPDDGKGGTLPILGCKTNSKGVVVQGNHMRYLFRGEDEKDVYEWVQSIQAALRDQQPLYNLYKSKKRAMEDSDQSYLPPFDEGKDDVGHSGASTTV